MIEESEDNDKEDNNDLKIGEILLELYQIDNTLNKFENCSIYSVNKIFFFNNID